MLNERLLLDTLERVEKLDAIQRATPEAELDKLPEVWRQQTWRHLTECGTACCFAGWAATLAGAKFSGTYDDEVLCGGDAVDIGVYAKAALGLTDVQASTLFAPDNTLEDLQNCVKSFIADEMILPQDMSWWPTHVRALRMDGVE